QAEDGIRDRNVTGVQTCALPIYSPSARRLQAPYSRLYSIQDACPLSYPAVLAAVCSRRPFLPEPTVPASSALYPITSRAFYTMTHHEWYKIRISSSQRSYR